MTSFLALFAVLAQAPPSVEVASVKPAAPNATGLDIRRDPAGGIVFSNATLRMLVNMAYNTQGFQLAGGPPGLLARRFDVVAKAPVGARKEQTWAMLQTLLAERFRLVVHRETRQMPVLELTVAKGGAKIRPAERQASVADGSAQTSPGRVKALRITMPDLAMVIAGVVGHKVVDRTGLDGRYDVELTFAVDEKDAERPSIYAAVQEQLGLRLVSSTGPVEMVVIDRVEMPGSN